jgi:restriction system protein
MVIPNNWDIALPLLLQIKNKKEYSVKIIENELVKYFKLSDEERNETKKSDRRETIFHNRVHWAKFYLKKAGLLEDSKKGYVKITSEGTKLIKKKVKKIDQKFLMQFPDFISYYSKKTKIKKKKVIRLRLERMDDVDENIGKTVPDTTSNDSTETDYENLDNNSSDKIDEYDSWKEDFGDISHN